MVFPIRETILHHEAQQRNGIEFTQKLGDGAAEVPAACASSAVGEKQNRPGGYTPPVTFDAFPGYPLVRQGLEDLASKRETIPALLVLVGAHRLRKIGIEVPPAMVSEPEHRLYEMLAAEDSDSAHSRYNALIRELVSFERAAECAA